MLERSIQRIVRIVVLFACCTATTALRAGENDPARPTAVTTVNVPVAPTKVFVHLAPYQNTRSAEFAGWAPDGRGVLIRTRFGEAAQLHRVLRPGGRREQLTFFSEPASGRYLRDEEQRGGEAADLLLSMSRNGDEQNQIYLLEPADYRLKMLTDGRSRNMLGPVSADGSSMVVRSNQRNGRDMDVYLADTRDPDSWDLIHKVTDEYWYGSHWSADGTELLMRRHISVTESTPAVYDVRSRKLTPLKPAIDSPAAYNNLRFSADSRSIYLTTDAFSEHRELVRYDRDSNTYHRLTADIQWDADEIAVDRRGRLAFTINQRGLSRLFLLDEDGRRTKLSSPPRSIIKSLRFSPDGSQLGFTRHGPTSPADVYSIKIADGGANGRSTRWTYSVVGGLDPSGFVAPTIESIPTFDGRVIEAFVYRPERRDDRKPSPVVVSLHGGPESQYRPYFSPRTQYLVNRLGCTVVCPNVRGSTGYGKTFVSLDDGYAREDSVRDVGAVLDWIAKQNDLDASRVAVRGRSYGGYLVLASLIRYGDRLRAGVNVVGLADFQSFLEHTESYRRAKRRVEYGDERDPATRDFFQRISPAHKIKAIKSPLLVIHGKNDPRVPFREATRVVDRLQALDREVWAVYVGDEGHMFSKRSNSDYVDVVESMFLSAYLGAPKTRAAAEKSY